LRVLVLTMSGQLHNVAEALQLGVLGYVLKGSPAAELLQAVEAVAAGRCHLGPGVPDLVARGLAAPAPQGDVLDLLSPRERQIVRLVVQGHSSAAIGQQLHLSPKTVDTYRSRLMAKLGVPDVVALVRMVVQAGLLEDEEH
jgi:DNA-binding NarL/FixJ family response regulator